MLEQYEGMGNLWETYIVVPGRADISVERYENTALHGWASAAVVVKGCLIGLADD